MEEIAAALRYVDDIVMLAGVDEIEDPETGEAYAVLTEDKAKQF